MLMTFFLFAVAYNKQEVEYVWTNPTNAVSYEGRLELSQFDIMRTEFRGLNYSRTHHGENKYFTLIRR